MLLDFQVASLPYSTAITDSLNSQVATAPLRIQFAGVTPVPLPPLTGHYGCQAACHMSQRASAAKTSPSGGSGAKHQKGCISLAPRARLACFPFARRAVVWFYHKGAPSFSRAPTTAFSPERSDATLLYNPWHREPEGPMDAIRPSEPKAQAPSGIQPPRSWPHARPQPVGPSTLRPKRPLNLIYYNFPHKKRSRQSSFFFQFYF